MALDEVTQICPVPVPSWLADSGGKGIQIITVAHGEAQLRGRWGPNGARIIMDTSGAKIWLPGISDTDTLDAASALCGTTPMKETHTLFERHDDQRDPYTRHPIMTPDMIRQLPARYALIVRGGMSPVIARLPMAWTDPAYKRARRARRAARLRAHEQQMPTWEAPSRHSHRRADETWPNAVPPSTSWDDPGRYPWQ
jgi:type IV secretion system protein VirD4